MLSTEHQSFKICNRQGKEIIGARFLRPFHNLLNLFYCYRLGVHQEDDIWLEKLETLENTRKY